MREAADHLQLIPVCGDSTARWGFLALAADAPPEECIDPDTGHRIERLSRKPNSASLYFKQNAYTADGNHVIITTPSGLSTIDLKSGAIETVVEGRVGVIVADRKSGQAGAERQLQSGYEVDRVPLQHVRPHPGVCRGAH